MMRLFRRWIARAVLSLSIVAATVGASYGRDASCSDISPAQQISDVAWRART